MTPTRQPICPHAWLLAFLLAACSTVPITGRQQLDVVPSGQMLAMSNDQYRKFMNENEVIRGTQDARMVTRVGQRIRSAVERYLASENMSAVVEGYNWEFNLVKDASANAWAMPGGKVAVYTGILPVTQNETGLATVIGHEVAHVVAQHGSERMSQGLVTQLGGMALSAALSQQPSQTVDLFMAAYGVGTQVGVLLPYSRTQEYEADRMGLIFMALAGYDPREAASFWQRMAARSEGGGPPEFLSTHPGHEGRVAHINKYLPEALRYYHR